LGHATGICYFYPFSININARSPFVHIAGSVVRSAYNFAESLIAGCDGHSVIQRVINTVFQAIHFSIASPVKSGSLFLFLPTDLMLVVRHSTDTTHNPASLKSALQNLTCEMWMGLFVFFVFAKACHCSLNNFHRASVTYYSSQSSLVSEIGNLDLYALHLENHQSESTKFCRNNSIHPAHPSRVVGQLKLVSSIRPFQHPVLFYC
jgi:hypothetical protein